MIKLEDERRSNYERRGKLLGISSATFVNDKEIANTASNQDFSVMYLTHLCFVRYP